MFVTVCIICFMAIKLVGMRLRFGFSCKVKTYAPTDPIRWRTKYFSFTISHRKFMVYMEIWSSYWLFNCVSTNDRVKIKYEFTSGECVSGASGGIDANWIWHCSCCCCYKYKKSMVLSSVKIIQSMFLITVHTSVLTASKISSISKIKVKLHRD